MSKVESLVRQALVCDSVPGARVIPPASAGYLPLAERIVRQSITWQDPETGRIIDPYVKEETNTVTARFVGALGLQLLQGRCLDLQDHCLKALTPVLEDLHSVATNHGEFLVKEACMAYWALQDKVPADLCAYWTRLLSEYDPEKAYACTLFTITDSMKKVSRANYPPDITTLLHNYSTFGIAGEAIKSKLKLAGNIDFMDKYVKYQLQRIDVNGMYNDPYSPMTYDMVPRMNLSLAIWAGYRGEYYELLSEALKRGAFSQLLYQSSTGEFPFGGRSNMQNFNEATFALICEFEACRWQEAGDVLMAGCFKRAAAMALAAIKKYLVADPIHFTKNLFPPDTQHGRQKTYGFYGAYSLLIASQLGFAALLADNAIQETKCPAECGGYVFETEKSFHKIFVNCRGTHLEIDYDAYKHYDSNGLGRVHFIGFPPELVLSAPITASPDFITACPPAVRNVTIGAGWLDADGKQLWLADVSEKKKRIVDKLMMEAGEQITFSITHRRLKNCRGITSEYSVRERELLVEETIAGYEGDFFVQLPLLITDGKTESTVKITTKAFIVTFGEYVYKAECLNREKVELYLEEFTAPNRNGVYKVGVIKTDRHKIKYRISVERNVQQ